MAEADEGFRAWTRPELTDEARQLAQGAPPQEGGRGLSPWAESNDERRALADEAENLHPGLPADQQRARGELPRERQPESALRDVEQRPSGRDFARRGQLLEPGVVGDLNALPGPDRHLALEQINHAATRPGVIGIPLTHPEEHPEPGTSPKRPEKLSGGWRALPFTPTVDDKIVQERDSLARGLRRTLPEGLDHVVRPALGVAPELGALPEEHKPFTMDAIRDLATNGPGEQDQKLDVFGRRAGEVRSRAVGGGHQLIYRETNPLKREMDQRKVIELLGVTRGGVTEQIGARIEPQGRVICRYLTGGFGPGGKPTLQVIAVQGGGQVANIKAADTHVEKRLAALEARTTKHQELTGRSTPLRYSAQAKNAQGEVVVEGAHQVGAAGANFAAINGLAATPVPQKAVSPATAAEQFTTHMAGHLPRGRAYDLVFAPGAEEDLRGLVNQAKGPVFGELRNLAANGPQPGDVRGTQQGPQGVDLRPYRARVLGGAANAADQPVIPPQQIIYRPVKAPTFSRGSGERVLEERGTIHVVTVRGHPDPEVSKIVAERKSAKYGADLTGTNRRLSAGPRLEPEARQAPREGEQQRAERLTPVPPNRASAAKLRPTTGQGPDVPKQQASTNEPALRRTTRSTPAKRPARRR
ncbi:hypothetical protein OG339_48115 (plasmid) [Streptosporangium sp. NBC_01495]|uniref:hypothetical protein n=1 Tax=Streptosporangium sp. NBC_01495 TaxID=2903899 RepID=UPI002E355974|nr:hypothetical protein [Streptosporangium sp. NBC_01495]